MTSPFTHAPGTMSAAAAATFPLAQGPAIHCVAAKIGLYKECLLLARTIKDPTTKTMTVAEIQTKWREHRGHGGMSLELALASTLDRIAYLRMCLPKSSQRRITAASECYDWGVINPMENQEKLQMKRREDKEIMDMKHETFGKGNREFVPKTNWGPGNVDPDMIKKHVELRDRQFFMGPHWRGKPKPLIYEDLSFEEQMQAHFAPPALSPQKVRKRY